MRKWAVLALAFALAGCFSSNGPVFDQARGDCPFETPTLYREIDEGTPGHFLFEADGASCKVTDPAGAVTHALFVPMGRNWWIVQGDEARPTYALMHRSGQRLTQYMPRCEEFSASRLTRLVVTFDEDRKNCTVTEARQIEHLFRGWPSPFRRATGAYRLVPRPPTPPSSPP
jgi:hypothetical protein